MKNFIFICAAALSLAAISCQKIKNEASQPVQEASIDATSKTTWTYFSLVKGQTVGTGEENEADNALWAARADWDFAVMRYNIRTNSGTSSSKGAKGGIFASDKTFDALQTIPSAGAFTVDRIVTSAGMGGVTSTSESGATVITFKTNPDGSKVMPPVYLKAPVYVVRSADGSGFYKVEFTQYQDENKVTGKVKFKFAEL